MKTKQTQTSILISEFLDGIKHLEEQYNISYEEVHECDLQSTDLLHQIELGSSKERNKFATRLSQVRKIRRVHKDFVDTNCEFVTFITSPEFKNVRNRLTQLLGKIRKQESIISAQRYYMPRSLQDLTIRTSIRNGDSR